MTRWTAARRTRLGLSCVALALALPGLAPGGPGHASAGTLVAQETATWVVLARHAEKLEGEDPGLTPEGTERARALAHVLSPWPIEVVYASQYLRTRTTAAPLAALLDLEPQVVDAADVSGLAARIRAEGRAAVAVIGHSNTVPALARALGAGGVPDIPEDRYDDLFVVRLTAEGGAELLHLKYGAASPD